MRNLFTLLFVGFVTAGAFAQYPLVQISDLNFVSQADLANCDDESDYYLDTVRVIGYVVTDGGLSEVESGSINGANGIRPFIFLNDTANQGEVGPWTGLEVMGVNWQTSQATAGFTSLIEGDLVEITGVVGDYQGATQFQPLNDGSLDIKASSYPTFTPAQISVGDLNDQNQANQLETGEQWEGAFVEVNNVQVVAVDQWGSGVGARTSFTVADLSGNTMQVYDFFVAQKLASWNTLNPNSPYSNGIFTPPSVGTFFTSLKGVIEHSGNGCTGFTGQGYRMHPFDSSHYEVGEAYPAFTFVNAIPSLPTSSDTITIEAEVIDQDGSIDSVQLFWTADTTLPFSAYTEASMNPGAGNIYTYQIPPQSDRTIINYYIRAVDNSANVSFYPVSISGQPTSSEKVIVWDGGFTIMDIQTPLSTNTDASPFATFEVTVEGIVTATSNPDSCGLGYVYIQDTTANEYAGIALRSSLDLNGLARNEYVRVTGTVDESFGFTQINVSDITHLGKGSGVEPVVLDPSDASQLQDYEKYESMIVTYRDSDGDPLYITSPDLGFAEYGISGDRNPATPQNERRILAGRQNGTQGQSSLYVSLVADIAYASMDGEMQVPAIATDTSISFESVTGPLWYAFGTYKLTPRTNFDFENASVELDTTGCNVSYFGAKEPKGMSEVDVYPNPAYTSFTVEVPHHEVHIAIYDLKGSLIARAENIGTGKLTFDARELDPGFYLIEVTGEKGAALGNYKIIITE